MSHSPASRCLLGLAQHFRRLNAADPLTQCLAPRLSRCLATATEIPIASIVEETQFAQTHIPSDTTSSRPITESIPSDGSKRVLTTLYSWPDLEPQNFAWYASNQLNLKLRRDILHRAVIYEADVHRGWSTASTKHRTQVHGSNRKLAPQKGLGRARVGDKKSPIRRGGGISHGPHPRDFSTELPSKIYDLAWRTALSHRYRLGELIVLDERMMLDLDATPRLLENIFKENKWDHANGRSLLVTDRVRNDEVSTEELEELYEGQQRLWLNMEQIGRHGSIKDLDDVDVKDLLETGRVIIDKVSLDQLLEEHSSDLSTRIKHVC